VRVFDYRCRAAKGDPTEPEEFTHASISLVRSGAFGFRSEGSVELLTPGFALLANPGQCYEISHEHAGGDRCIAFRFEEGALDEAVGGAVRRRYFARSVLPPSHAPRRSVRSLKSSSPRVRCWRSRRLASRSPPMRPCSRRILARRSPADAPLVA
jgi:hypothetical protein